MQLAIEIPDELFLSINESKQNLIELAKQKLALELCKSHKISISQGAKFLDMDIYSFMKLLNKHQIPAIDDYDIEVECQINNRLSSKEIAKVVEVSQRIEGYADASKELELEVEVFMKRHNLEVSA